MGDKNPKSQNRKAAQKQAKHDSADQRKKDAIMAKQAPAAAKKK